jgi:hypothetical protein
MRRGGGYGGVVSEEDGVIGDEPLRDDMLISVRMRRDFYVEDAARVLDAARQAYRELHPDEDPNAALTHVTSAADALFTILEHAGLFSAEIGERLAARSADGLLGMGSRAMAVMDDPVPLISCLGPRDPFALPHKMSDD